MEYAKTTSDIGTVLRCACGNVVDLTRFVPGETFACPACRQAHVTPGSSVSPTAVTTVRAGKFIQLSVAESEESVAAKQVEEMCEKLLANPIIEQFRYELERIDDPE